MWGELCEGRVTSLRDPGLGVRLGWWAVGEASQLPDEWNPEVEGWGHRDSYRRNDSMPRMLWSVGGGGPEQLCWMRGTRGLITQLRPLRCVPLSQ